MNISWEGKGNIRKSSWKAFRAIFTVTDTLLLYMPDNKDSPAGIEALMPWSDFVKERCTGGVNRKMVIPGIKKFMNEEGQVNLAISLHASNNTLRSRIMPINKAYPLNELMETIKEYINKTNRRVTFEYIMLDNVNDSEENAKELALLLKGINCYVNLIPYNETENIEFKRTKEWKIMKFYDILKKNKINVTIRKEFGGSVDAACGQLRANN